MTEIGLDAKTGYVVPPENPGKLFEAILDLIQNPLKAKTMGTEGKKVVLAKFTLKKMTDQYEQLFLEHLKS